MQQPSGAGAVGVISPHLDDAVLSCSSVITPGSVVVTVFASGPKLVDPLPAWDAAAGFNVGDNVFAVRSQEDDEALTLLGASGLRLTYWEAQYRASPPRWPRASHLLRLLSRRPPHLDEGLALKVLTGLLESIAGIGITTWYAPLGICHPDHQILGAILPQLVTHSDEIGWYIYDDLPYALERPDERDAAHQRLASEGLELVEVSTVRMTERKRASVDCYRSQLGALGDRAQAAIDAAEIVHRVTGNGANRI